MVIFWMVFVIVIVCIFSYNSEIIKKNFNVFKERLAAPSGANDVLFLPNDDSFLNTDADQISQPDVFQTPNSADEVQPAAANTPPAAVVPSPPPANTSNEISGGSQTQTQTQTTPQPTTQTQTQTTVQPTTQTQTPTPPVQMRDRAIYFTQVNTDGQILQSKVTRRLPVTQSPMMDALNVLLSGLTAEELSRGLINLIPANTRIISATVRGNTAYINFSEDFLINKYGVDGYVAQLRQIVWTVTEFSNVHDVQFLIEGMRIDYLGEGIWIGSPISRQSF